MLNQVDPNCSSEQQIVVAPKVDDLSSNSTASQLVVGASSPSLLISESTQTKEEPVVTVDESKLRKVSLTTNDFLFTRNQSNTFDTNQKVFEMLMQMKNKYRLFLIT